jgi:hypothetical protein
MSLLADLEEAKRLVSLCEGMPEACRARMNFLVNLVTIVEVHSACQLKKKPNINLPGCQLTFNATVDAVLNDKEQRRLIREMTKIRNKFVHQGKAIPIDQERTEVYYFTTKQVLLSNPVDL